MTKKFISLLISVIMVVGLIPVMSVSAAGGTPITVDDFENYNEGVIVNSAGAEFTLKVGDTPKWTFGKVTNAEIVKMIGYDGEETKALKFINNYHTSKYNDNIYRLKAEKQSAYKALNGKLYVQEFRLWLPANVTSGGTIIDYKRPKKITMGYNTAIEGTTLKLSDVPTTYTTIPANQWIKITSIADYTNWSKAGDPITYAMYVDDQNVFYRVNDTTDIRKPDTSKYTNAYWFISEAYSEANVRDQYFIVDDVNIYTNPSETEMISNIASDATGISRTVCPEIRFTNRLFESEDYADGKIDEKVELIATSGATPVDISLSSDGKTLTIDPRDDLDYGTQYTVKLTGLKDMYGRAIADTQFSFTTVEPSSITASQPVFTKENLFAAGGASDDITVLKNGYIKATATVNNSAKEDKDVLVLAMLKEGEDIKYFQFKNITVHANSSAVFTAGFQVDDANSQKIETVVWDSIENKTPLADKYEFSSSGYVKTDLDTLLGE